MADHPAFSSPEFDFEDALRGLDLPPPVLRPTERHPSQSFKAEPSRSPVGKSRVEPHDRSYRKDVRQEILSRGGDILPQRFFETLCMTPSYYLP